MSEIRKPHILLATPLSPPDIGGPATYSAFISKELRAQGYSISVISFSDVRYLPVGIRHMIYFFRLLYVGRKTDIVYALDPVSVGVPAALATFILRKRFFLRIAGDYAWEQASGRFGITESPHVFVKKYDTYPFIIRVLKEVQSEVAKRAEKIITPSAYLKKVIIEWGVSPNTIAVIHNAVSSGGIQKRKKVIRGLLNFDGKLVITAGRLIPLKGFKSLIQLMSDLKKVYGNIKLLIVGDGPDMELLQQEVQKRKLEDAVILTGALTQDVLFGYIQASDVFVLNALHETFSHQILEVMLLEVPVVATNVGGNPEIIRNGVDGILVPHNNKKELSLAIRKVLDDDIYARKITRSARKRVELFNKESVLEGHIKILQ